MFEKKFSLRVSSSALEGGMVSALNIVPFGKQDSEKKYCRLGGYGLLSELK